MYKKIVVPLDGSELAECVFPHLKAVANGCGTMELVLVRVVEPSTQPIGSLTDLSGVFTSEDAEALRKRNDTFHEAEAKAYLEQAKEKVSQNLDVIPATEMLRGKPAEVLADYVTKHGADLVMLSTHGRSGISRWALGSTADKLVRSVCTPVMMIRAPGCVPGI